ncbi:TetR/AcrR family transcriptional regulator [Pseudomonas cremoricolorata]|uniref:HTH tetR-type domain-containing protein n=1 Tax=Pseudomonas cremoricolorata TaxID=157783 RepID=A0A089YEY4_9PSED|nr:TetR/AcrR family transcriptional regulator [Pseudomonas cremoricolorata]AIR90303.1 hypothetical protein LK03_13785 [Pseudomonas cremoricolorata]
MVLSRVEFQRKAVELFQQRGFSSVSMRELAAHVGISPGSIYHHIENKETLLYELLFELYQALNAQLRTVKRRRLATAKALSQVIDGHLDLYERMPGHFRLANMEHGQLSPPLAADIALLRSRYEQQMLQLFRSEATAGEGQLGDAGLLALFAMLHALPGWLDPQLDGMQRRQLARSMLGGALQGARSLA